MIFPPMRSKNRAPRESVAPSGPFLCFCGNQTRLVVVAEGAIFLPVTPDAGVQSNPHPTVSAIDPAAAAAYDLVEFTEYSHAGDALADEERTRIS